MTGIKQIELRQDNIVHTIHEARWKANYSVSKAGRYTASQIPK